MVAATTQSRLIRCIVVMTMLLTTGCYKSVIVKVDESQIQQRVDAQYPQTRDIELMRYKAEVKMERPEVDLLPSVNRMRVKLPVSAKPKAIPVSAKGSVTVTGGLRYEPKDYTFYLTDLEIEDITLPMGAASMINDREKFKDALADFIVLTMGEIPLHTLDKSKLDERAERYLFKSATIRGSVVEILLELP